MDITKMIISALIKKGIVSEARNVKLELAIPELKGTLTVTCEHIVTKFEKNEKESP